MKPLTRDEVKAWPPLGPMGLEPYRVLALFEDIECLRAAETALMLKLDDLRAERDGIFKALPVTTNGDADMAGQIRSYIADLHEAERQRDHFAQESDKLKLAVLSLEAQRDEARKQTQHYVDMLNVTDKMRLKTEAELDAARTGEKAAQEDRALWQAEAERSKAEFQIANQQLAQSVAEGAALRVALEKLPRLDPKTAGWGEFGGMRERDDGDYIRHEDLVAALSLPTSTATKKE